MSENFVFDTWHLWVASCIFGPFLCCHLLYLIIYLNITLDVVFMIKVFFVHNNPKAQKNFVPKSGCFCSEINLAPPSLKSCIRPCIVFLFSFGIIFFNKINQFWRLKELWWGTLRRHENWKYFVWRKEVVSERRLGNWKRTI